MTDNRLDGWYNVATYLGAKGKDRTRSGKFQAENRLDYHTLESLYRSDGFAKKIVDLIATEMTRQWICVKGDEDNAILGRLEEINAKEKITDLIRWSRLFGGAIAIIGADDGGELFEPLNENAIRSIDFLHVFDRWQVTWTITETYRDPRMAKYGMPELYRVTPIYTGEQFLVHESRVLRMDAEKLPSRALQRNEGWGDSVLQGPYDQLRNLGAAYNATSNIMEDFIQTILKVENLSDLLASGQDELIKKRLDIIDMSRSVANTVILDSNESYEKKSSSVGGLDGLIDKFALALSATTGIPITFLMGQTPAGLQSTGQADIRMFYDMVKAEQEDTLKPILERLIRLVMLSRNGPLNGRELSEWSIEFNPLWQLSDKEQADYRKVVAETDALYINTGVLDPSEVAISRFGGESYSFETSIDTRARETPELDPEPEPAEQQEQEQPNSEESNLNNNI